MTPSLDVSTNPLLVIQPLISHPDSNAIFPCLWPFLNHEEWLTSEKLAQTVSLLMPHDALSELHNQLNSWMDHAIIPKLTEDLNRQHGSSHSASYWAILLKPWLGLMVNTTYYYYLILKKVFSQTPHVQTNLIQLAHAFEFKDSFVFISQGHQSPDLHTLMLSDLLRHCFSSNITILKEESYAPSRLNADEPIESMPDHRARRCMGIHATPDHYEMMLALILNLKPAISSTPPDHSFIPPYPGLEMPASLEGVIFQLLKNTMPLSFTRFYERYQNQAEKLTYKKGKIRLFGAVSSHVEQLKYYLANAKEKGEILIAMQHGGNYGWHLSHREPCLFEHRFDYFFSWGWTQNDDRYAKIIPLPSPYLSRMKDKHRFQSKDMILVGTDVNPFLTACIPAFHEGRKSLEYREDKLRFLDMLEAPVRQKLTYRGYPHLNNRFSDSPFITAKFSDLCLLKGSKKKLMKALFKTELCIMDHLGTTLLICLSANVPFVCFWKPEYCDLNPSGQALVQEMKNENLYFESAEEAALFINGLTDIPQWWAQKQALRNKLVQAHALNTPWFFKWIKTLWNLR